MCTFYEFVIGTKGNKRQMNVKHRSCLQVDMDEANLRQSLKDRQHGSGRILLSTLLLH